MSTHVRIGVVTQVGLSGSILVLHFGSGQDQRSGTIRLQRERESLKNRRPLVQLFCYFNHLLHIFLYRDNIFSGLFIHSIRKKHTSRIGSSKLPRTIRTDDLDSERFIYFIFNGGIGLDSQSCEVIYLSIDYKVFCLYN